MERRRFLIGGAALCACPVLARGRACALVAPSDGSRLSALDDPAASWEGGEEFRAALGTGGDSDAESPTAATGAEGPVDAGALASFAEEGIHADLAATRGFFIVRRGGRLYAPSAICTHQGAPLTTLGSKIVCERHGSLFTEQGAVRKGPARFPLPRYKIALDEARHVIVDTSVGYTKEQWTEAGAFIDLDAERDS
jgi:Rieske Fe-S protein